MNNGSRPKFLFKNLGPIKEAELELGDLTIIAGRNNTGKTYVAYALYGFLKRWPFPIIADARSLTVPPFSQLVLEAGKAGMLKLPTDQKALELRRTEILKWITQHYSEYTLPEVFNADAEAFKNASFDVLLRDPPDIDPERFRDSWLSLNQEGDEWILSPKVAHPQGSSYFIDLAHSYLHIMFPELLFAVPKPFILTSERFSISIFHRELDFARSELVEKLLQMRSDDNEKESGARSDLIKKAASRYARPIRDNLNFTRDIPDWADRKSGLYEQKRHDDIKRMMQGYYRVENGGVRFVSTARGDRRFNIPLYRASSSARGLSDMYFYMRHVAEPGQLLMVDEPEAHLDTANQIEMARLLARLARAGMKVFITTHSDYIVKEINNLIMLGRDFRDKERVAKKYGYDEGECLDANQVRGYIAEKNGLKLCDMNDYGIDYPNFDETINNVNRRARAFAEHVWAERKK
ncbi:MAG: AAA family ATPase [Candidatus Poribacteria bacterium]|nr:AAA family ATPase [Candidatus Poribacteria bacterium]